MKKFRTIIQLIFFIPIQFLVFCIVLLFTGFAVLLSIPSILGDSFTLIETLATSAAYIIAFWFCYKKSSDGNPIREALNEREI